jgi:hypothetical protein
MEAISECYIELHSSSVELPYDIVNPGETLGLFTLKLKTTPIREGPFHFVFMIDATLSMSEKDDHGMTKWEYMKETLKKMLGYLANLEPQIYVTIYTFNTSSSPLVNNLLLCKASVQFVLELINDVHPEGCTNIENALSEVKSILSQKTPDYEVAHVFMTDGEATEGIANPDELATLIDTSVPNIFIGFGNNHNAQLLSGLAKCKNSEYYFVDDLEKSILVYAESTHSILYRALQNVEFRIRNGYFYDYVSNRWTDVLYENTLSSECYKYYQIKTQMSEQVVVDIICEGRIIDTATPLPELYDVEYGVLLQTDLTKYAYRKRVQELLFKVNGLKELTLNVPSSDIDSEDANYLETASKNIKKDMRETLSDIRKYMLENHLLDDPLLRLLCEDLNITIKSMGLCSELCRMYVGARQTSQGKQRSYNVGSSILDTVKYNDLGVNDTTCFASPSMLTAFRQATQ